MSQAEIASGTFTPANEFPSKGHLLRDFSLETTSGNRINLSDYRGRASLVLVFPGDEDGSSKLLSDLAMRSAEIKQEEAEVLAITGPGHDRVQESQDEANVPYAGLIDRDGRLHEQFGAVDAQGRACAAVYITDHFAEVFAVYRSRDGQKLPTFTEILSWLEFVNSQCPECEAPEWPI
jgi:peroxiredoxin